MVMVMHGLIRTVLDSGKPKHNACNETGAAPSRCSPLFFIMGGKLMNEIYDDFFADNPLARSAVEVAALPLGAWVEIEAIALVKTVSS